VLKCSGYRITEVDIGNLEEGTLIHSKMCIHQDSVIAILMENWEQHPRPNATEELQKLAIVQNIP
jgi:hypothetical protein